MESSYWEEEEEEGDEAEEKSSYPGFGERGIMGTIPLRGPQASSAGGCEERVVSSFSYGEEAKKKGSSSSLRPSSSFEEQAKNG